MYTKVADLKNKKLASEHLSIAFKYLKHEDFLFTLYNVAIAQGFAEVAEKVGLSRENLYKILAPTANPSWKIISAVLHALGFTCTFEEPRIRGQNFTQLSLTDAHPELVEQWHSTKNGTIKPDYVIPTSRKKVWWICNVNKKHEWEELIITRANGANCPFCDAISVMEKLNN